MAEAQFTLRGCVAHIQVRNGGGYNKFDTAATPEIVAAYNAAKAAGVTVDSMYGSDTQYAPLEVRTVTKRALVFVPPPAPVGEVVVYTD